MQAVVIDAAAASRKLPAWNELPLSLRTLCEAAEAAHDLFVHFEHLALEARHAGELDMYAALDKAAQWQYTSWCGLESVARPMLAPYVTVCS